MFRTLSMGKIISQGFIFLRVKFGESFKGPKWQPIVTYTHKQQISPLSHLSHFVGCFPFNMSSQTHFV
jgi:hypothetical protein